MNFRIKRQRAPPTRTLLLVRWARFLFLFVGVLTLRYCAVVLLDRWLFQAYQTWRFERARGRYATHRRFFRLLPQRI